MTFDPEDRRLALSTLGRSPAGPPRGIPHHSRCTRTRERGQGYRSCGRSHGARPRGEAAARAPGELDGSARTILGCPARPSAKKNFRRPQSLNSPTAAAVCSLSDGWDCRVLPGYSAGSKPVFRWRASELGSSHVDFLTQLVGRIYRHWCRNIVLDIGLRLSDGVVVKPEQPMTKPMISFRASPEVAEAIRALAAEDRRPISQFLAVLVEDAIAKRKPAERQHPAAA